MRLWDALRAIGYRRKARGDGYENSMVEEPRCFLLGELVVLVRLVVLGVLVALGILVALGVLGILVASNTRYYFTSAPLAL